jgi:glycosyltransferase involved in cell wall biosynthesis/GT2 family glycosyltransferase
MSLPSFSIVINTLNRGPVLQKTLDSFRWLKYAGEFEVVVVNGPSTDNSEQVIESWLPHIRAGKCDVANLSVSRNVGICMAKGDIIAFIDDDAIPEPEWLAQLAEAYSDPMVGAVGGLVFNHTGYDFQYKYCLVDRFGNADLSLPGPMPHLSFPKSGRFPHLLGCNSSFRRSALLEIGGFDEEYEYFLDETDVCLRIVDAGYIIAQLPKAYVHHKYAPSNIRGENKVVRYRYPIIKNKIYFMLKHSKEFYSLERIMEEQQAFIQAQRNDVDWCHSQGLLSDSDVATFEVDLKRAIEIGLSRGIEGVKIDAMISNDKLERYNGNFKQFNLSIADDFKSIVLISRDYPPNHGGGIATFTKDLAESLGALGNIVHVITLSADNNRVDFENGVWIHRIVLRDIELSYEARKRNIPKHIWDWSATAFEEAIRIASHRQIDVIEAPIWDCEGVAFYLDRRWPLVTSLHTTLKFWLDTHDEKRNDDDWMNGFAVPMLSLEHELMVKADGVRANSKAIINEIEKKYQFQFPERITKLIPHGMAFSSAVESTVVNSGIEILYVGRLELRKGIDIFLQAIPQVLRSIPNSRVKVIGDNTLLGPDGLTFMDKFLSDSSNKDLLDRIIFKGRVGDDELLRAYKACDIFVAPSRFESFGLIFLEAMREAKPVIGCNAGGIPEVVVNEVNGLLIEPGNIKQLFDAILRLALNQDLRLKMGEAGKRIFEEKFTSKRMANESVILYSIAKSNYLSK